MTTAVQTEHLAEQIAEARAQSDSLFSLLRPGMLYERGVAERHRFIFYLGHLDCFDWNLLGVGHLRLSRFHSEFDRLFAFGIDPGSDALPVDGPEDWPSLESISQYCLEARRHLDRHIGALPEQLLHVALEHRLMHLETLTYLLHNLDAQKLIVEPGYSATLLADVKTTSGQSARNPWMEIPEGNATLGLPASANRSTPFGWDNEFPLNVQHVDAFQVQKYKVTNGDYLDYVESGAPAPHFWRRIGGAWKLRVMFGEVSLPMEWPVYVTHREASGYAAWKQCRLLSEAEFHRAAFGTSAGEQRFPWGDTPAKAVGSNFGLRRWDPEPVTAHPEGDSAFGVSQLVGNGWEWTATPFRPFPGFEPFPFYPGYSADFFDQQHFILKGASPRTAIPLVRRSFRNWFRDDYSYAFATFRCVSLR